MTDLFEAASRAARTAAPAPATGLDALQPSGRFEKWGSAVLFVHHCAKCGAVDAPHGYRCHLRAALREPVDPRKAGIWLCDGCSAELQAEGVAA